MELVATQQAAHHAQHQLAARRKDAQQAEAASHSPLGAEGLEPPDLVFVHHRPPEHQQPAAERMLYTRHTHINTHGHTHKHRHTHERDAPETRTRTAHEQQATDLQDEAALALVHAFRTSQAGGDEALLLCHHLVLQLVQLLQHSVLRRGPHGCRPVPERRPLLLHHPPRHVGGQNGGDAAAGAVLGLPPLEGAHDAVVLEAEGELRDDLAVVALLACVVPPREEAGALPVVGGPRQYVACLHAVVPPHVNTPTPTHGHTHTRPHTHTYAATHT